jgi:hypothetical protein
MQTPRSIALVLAATVGLASLAGCSPAAPTGAPTGTQVGTQAPVTAARATIAADAQAVSQIQADLSDMDNMADTESGFATQALGVPAAGPGMVSATAIVAPRLVKRAQVNDKVKAAAKGIRPEVKTRLATKATEMRKKAAGRLKGAADAFKKGSQREVVDPNEFGGKTFSFTFDFKMPNGATRVGSTERVFDGEKALVSASQNQTWTGPNGRTRTFDRTKELQADGSYMVTGTASDTFNGKTRTMTWTKTISPDGKVSGTGTMTRDGKTITMTFGGTEEKETTTVTDPTTNATATTEATAESGASATVTVTEGGATTTVPVSDETAAPAASAAPSAAASATPEASAAPAASAMPAASASPAASPAASASPAAAASAAATV